MKCSKSLATASHADADGQDIPFQKRAWLSGFPYPVAITFTYKIELCQSGELITRLPTMSPVVISQDMS